VQRAKAVAGDRLVSGFSWIDVARIARDDGTLPGPVLADLRAAGLEAVAEVPIDEPESASAAMEALLAAGFEQVRLTCGRGPADRLAAMLEIAALQDRVGGIQVVNPLPVISRSSSAPSTGYDDVKAVALARLAVPNVPSVQVDWARYGPKLAQVALTFGADDLDGVPAIDDAAQGPRRALIAEVRRNIEAAAFTPAERDGRFRILA
jgi:aminodeoxyfutalosine synthase